MSLSKGKCWYSNNYLKRAAPLFTNFKVVPSSVTCSTIVGEAANAEQGAERIGGGVELGLAAP
jgi:hypothetical protein